MNVYTGMKVKSFIFLILLLALALPATVQAQEPVARFERISIEHGLSQVTIYCIFQDSRGLMWFGTEDGLNKYDGYTFTVYKRDPEDPRSLSANTIRAIYEDRAGALWIGTDGGGLNRFDRASELFTRYQHDPANPHSLSHDTVTAMLEDSSGALWIGTDGGGLNQLVLSDNEGLDRQTGQFIHYQNDPADPHSLSHDSVTALYADPSGLLWVGTLGGGLNQLDPVTGQLTAYQHNPADPHSLSHDEVTSIFPSQTGDLWVGTYGGLNRFDQRTQQFSRYLKDTDEPGSLISDQVVAVYEDSTGDLWAGTPDGLDVLVLSQSPEFIHYHHNSLDSHSLSLNDITAIYEDKSGLIWIGTAVGGLNKFDRKTQRFTHYRHDPTDPHSLSSSTVWAIYEDRAGTLWIGTSDATGGLNRLDRASGQFTHYRYDPDDPHSLSANSALAIYEDSTGAFWVGSYEGGLNQLDRATGQFTHYRHDPANPHSLSSDVVWAIYEDRSGALWLGTFRGGLDKLVLSPALSEAEGEDEGFDRRTGQFTHYRHDPTNPASLSSDIVLTMYQDRAGTLWVGTADGLNELALSAAEGVDPAAQQFIHYRHDPADPHSLSSNAIPVIFEDSSGILWFGTDDGLNKLDRPSKTFTHYTEKDGLANDAIGGILEDEQGYLWISSGKGISRFNPRTGEFKNYDERDGLQSNEFNRGAFYKSKNGQMFFGGVNGVNAFYPADITDNPHQPPVILADFRLFNKSAPIGGDSPLQKAIGETDALTLSYRDYVFSFEFAALDYASPTKNQYAYMLAGFDQGWNYVDSSRRFASYANLPAGAYTFKVKGSNNDGVWNETGTSIAITVTPPPWKTWWAYTLYALAGLAVVGAVVRYRLQELQRKYLEQTMWAVQTERDRIAALLESRRQLVASISHDLRTPVAIVRGHLESLEQKTFGVLETPKVSLEVLLQELDRLQALLDDLFTLSRLEVDQLALHPAPTDIEAVARRAVNAMAQPAWQQGKVTVTLETTAANLCAQADEQRLLQVLMNLLHNAARHTLPGGLVVVNLSSEPGSVVIKVQDTGEGINPADLPHLWERFYRGQSRAEGGTGLGLALVKELTEAMGGAVAVTSTPGEGSCFTVTLPCA